MQHFNNNNNNNTIKLHNKTPMVDVLFYLVCRYPEISTHLTDRRYWRNPTEFPTLCGVHVRWTAQEKCGYCIYNNIPKYLAPKNERKRILKDLTLTQKSKVVKEKCLIRGPEVAKVLVFSRMKTKKTYLSVWLGIEPSQVIPEGSYIYELIYCHLVGMTFLREQYIE